MFTFQRARGLRARICGGGLGRSRKTATTGGRGGGDGWGDGVGAREVGIFVDAVEEAFDNAESYEAAEIDVAKGRGVFGIPLFDGKTLGEGGIKFDDADTVNDFAAGGPWEDVEDLFGVGSDIGWVVADARMTCCDWIAEGGRNRWRRGYCCFSRVRGGVRCWSKGSVDIYGTFPLHFWI